MKKFAVLIICAIALLIISGCGLREPNSAEGLPPEITTREENAGIGATTEDDEYAEYYEDPYVFGQEEEYCPFPMQVMQLREDTRLPVLLYHHILPDALNTYHRDNAAVISLEDFEAQMNYLYTNDFTTITLTQLENFLFHGEPLPERSVMIHFDDGYYSNFVYAMPVLERYGFVAQIFLIGVIIYDRGDVQPPMDYAGLTFTAAKTIEGTEHVFETANHTFATHHLAEGTNFTAFVYYDLDYVTQDIIRGFDFVNDHRAFAYPRGQYSDETVEMLESLGITMAFTVQNGYITMDFDHMRLPRFIVFPNTPMELFIDTVNGRR